MPDVFVYDRQTGQTELVSVDANGVNVYGYFYAPSISDDGRYVAFYGYSTDLVPGNDRLAQPRLRPRPPDGSRQPRLGQVQWGPG